MIKISSIENYEIIKEIGKGSFSNVYLVKKKENQKYYALKKVNISNMSTKERENALKEVNFLAEIKDNNVIGYEESFYDKDMNILYLVMEYAPYGDLNKIITNNNKLKIYFSESE
jgi:NIMA (never in mitosis gene a)-related kinase